MSLITNNIDYNRKSPQSYLVLVPGVSLVIQMIQLANILPLPVIPAFPAVPNRYQLGDYPEKARKFTTLSKWHFAGATAQLAACIIVLTTFKIQAFALIVLFPILEMGYTTISVIKTDARDIIIL